MRGSMNFCQGGPGPTAKNKLCQRFLSFFCPQLLQFYSGLSMVYFKENYNLTRFLVGWGVQPIPGAGAGGPNANSRNP